MTEQPKKQSLEQFSALLADVRSEWDKAEHCIKLSEHFLKRVQTPSIKELRYGGRRLVEALNDAHSGKPDVEIEKKLNDVLFRCHCAQHDAIDVSLDVMAIDFYEMEKKLGYEAIIGAFPDFPDLYADFDEARNLQALSRGQRDNRQAIYDTVTQTNLPSLAQRYGRLKACKPIMLKLAAKSRWARIAWWVMFAIAVSSVSMLAWKTFFAAEQP